MKKIKQVLLFSIFLFYCIGLYNLSFGEDISTKNILYFNSYHEGYKWSDDVLDGIKSQLDTYDKNIKLNIEYMDTQRITDKKYIIKLEDLYKQKFKDKKFDIILVSDDAAFNILIKNGEEMFPNTPIVFCGVNYFEENMIKGKNMVTGVVEGYDIHKTIDIALKFHPNTETIYYINDETISGKAVMKEFKKVMQKFEDSIEFIQIEGQSLREIEDKVRDLPQNCIIFHLAYFQDLSGNHFEYYESISRIEKQSSVPIYGLGDFHLGHGIVGGMLVSGYQQGEAAAKIALRILDGEKPSNIPVNIEKNNNSYKFDYQQLEKFNIPLEKLPFDSIIINHKPTLKKQILILNSYNKGLKWTDDIEIGIQKALGKKIEGIEFTYEYMDIKKNSNPKYIRKINEFLKEKYVNKKFDMIITTDDDAFSFALNNNNGFLKSVPVIFCGVNHFDDSILRNNKNITGVVEAYDLKSTLDIALSLHPNTKKVVVINDMTLTGKANKKNVNKIIPQYSERVAFEFWENENMSYLRQKVKTLKNDTIILLLSFTRDKSFNEFSYDESIKLISEGANVPIYSVWDFYLGKGLLGGMLTSGYTQGNAVGKMVLEVLEGKAPNDIPVVTDSPNIIMFDYKKMKSLGISMNDIPEGSKVMNLPFSYKDFFIEHKEITLFFLVVFCCILIFSVVIGLLLKNTKIRKEADRERSYAMTDMLTGVLNRRACFDCLNKLIESSQNEIFSICFLDINGLKKVNDSFGHLEGDKLIQTVCQLIESNIRDTDILCRLSGDEFLIILPETNREETQKIWQNVQNAMNDFNAQGLKPYTISVSVGFAEYNHEKPYSIDEFIEIADSEMYENKMLYKKNKLNKKQELNITI